MPKQQTNEDQGQQMRHRYSKIEIQAFRTEKSFLTKPNNSMLRSRLKLEFELEHFLIVEGEFSFERKEDSKEFLAIQIAVTFDIYPEDFKKYQISDTRLELPNAIGIFFCEHVVGVARGVLAAKTENTIFEDCFINAVGGYKNFPDILEIDKHKYVHV